MRSVSKEIFLNTLVCPTLGWVLRNEDILGLTDSDHLTAAHRFRIEQGVEIGRRARLLYPGGTLVSGPSFATSCDLTRSCLPDPSINAIFEGAFQAGAYATRADVLVRQGDAWRVTEVKSNTNFTPELVDDLAYTTMVLTRWGLSISSASLLLISKEYRLGMDDQHLFVESDYTVEALARAEELESAMDLVEALTSASAKPEPELKYACRQCPLFHDCTGKGVEHPVFEIPNLREQKFNTLNEAGIISILQLPEDFALTENQKRVTESVRTRTTYIGATLGRELDRIEWPAHYLDFEVAATAIPLYQDVAPYERVPFQYSAHKCNGIGEITNHLAFLADALGDPRRELAQRLILDLSGTGSIIVYSGFEKAIINGLAALFTDLNRELNSIIARLVDLHDVLRRNFYHPGFKGSTSLKTTLPILVPGMSYDHLPINNGESAMAEFSLLVLGRYSDGEAATVRSGLLEYCKLDTLALVKLHAHLAEFV